MLLLESFLSLLSHGGWWLSSRKVGKSSTKTRVWDKVAVGEAKLISPGVIPNVAFGNEHCLRGLHLW
jgi:hypothetical protein